MAPKTRKPAAAVVKSAAMKDQVKTAKTTKSGNKKVKDDTDSVCKAGTPMQYKHYCRVGRNVLSAEGWVKAPPVASQRLCDALRQAQSSGFTKEMELTLTFQPMISCKYEVLQTPASTPDNRVGLILKRILEFGVFKAVFRLECDVQ